MEVKELAAVELEVISTADLRAVGTKVQDTALGKRNRISIGYPLVQQVKTPRQHKLLLAEDVRQFNTERYEFFVLNLSFTLLPDEGCRFRSADFMVDMGQQNEGVPLVLRLEPDKNTTITKIKRSRTASVNAGVKDSVLQILELGLTDSENVEQEWDAHNVHLESFGTLTSEAGWRVRMTESQEIPLNVKGLSLLCVRSIHTPLVANFRVVAEIDILSPVDKWITWAFRQKKSPEVNMRYTIS